MRALDYAFRQGWASLLAEPRLQHLRGRRHCPGDDRARRAAARDLERRARAGAMDHGRRVLGLPPGRCHVGAARRDRGGHRRKRRHGRARIRVEGRGADALPPRVRRARVADRAASTTTRFLHRSKCGCRSDAEADGQRRRAGPPVWRRCLAWPMCATTASGWRASAAGLGTIRAAGLALATLMALAAAVTVAAVVRLGLHARREEIEIMELVGAPLTFIRGPFVAEGLLQGGIGAALALLSCSGSSIPLAASWWGAAAERADGRAGRSSSCPSGFWRSWSRAAWRSAARADLPPRGTPDKRR